MAYRLLIVPGENEALHALTGELASDAEIQVVENANDALWVVRQTPPEIILADVDLPGMSGLDLAEILPNFGASTKLVLWNRIDDPQLRQQATSAGVVHVFTGTPPIEDVRTVLGKVAAEAVVVPEPEPEPAPAPPPPAAAAPKSAEPARPDPAPVREERAEPPARTEQPTRVEPPTRAERPARVEPPARTEPPRPAAPAPAARRPLSRGRQGPIVLTDAMITPIKSRIVELQQEVGAQCILLTDPNGMVLVECGKTAGLPTMILLPMLSTSFSAAGQISQMLRETESSALYMQEGTFYDLYCFDIVRSFMLVLFFDKSASATKIGTVWVYAKRAIRDMTEHLM